MSFQVCPFHGDEAISGAPLGDSDGTLVYTCTLKKAHPDHIDWTWTWVLEPADLSALGGLAAELSLDFELPKAVASYDGRWVEYGLVERTYALAQPKDFAGLIERFGHSEQAGHKNYTASAYLASTLGQLSRSGAVLFHSGPGTGRWDYNSTISYWAMPPEPSWDDRLSWAASGVAVDYIG